MVVVNAVMHVFEERAEVLFERVNDIEQYGKGRNGSVVLDLGDQALADTGLGSQLLERNVLLCAFGLDLITEKEKKFFVHIPGGLTGKVNKLQRIQVGGQVGDMVGIEIVHLELHQLMPGGGKIRSVPKPDRKMQGMAPADGLLQTVESGIRDP